MSNELLGSLASLHRECDLRNYHMLFCDQSKPLAPCERGLASALTARHDPTQEQIREIHSVVDSSLAAKLVNFAIRMGSVALSRCDAAFLRAGVIALTLDNDEIDVRDVYVALAVLNDAANRIGVNACEMLETESRFATRQRRAAMVYGFAHGPSYMKSLKSMGVDLVDEPDGAFYKVRML